MSIRKTALAVAVAGALSLPVAANAFEIHGIPIITGAMFEFALLAEGERYDLTKAACGNLGGPAKCGNNDGEINQVGEELVGVGKIMEITDIGGNVVWSDGDNGRELTFYFYDFIAENFLVTGGTTATIGFTGGRIDVYSELNPTAATRFERNGTQVDDIARASNGDLWLQLAGSAIGADSLTGDFGALSLKPITLTSTGSFGTTGQILGSGNLDVVGGPAGPYLDTNTFNCVSAPDTEGACPDIADKTFTSSGTLTATGNPQNWLFLGTGEITDEGRVPEPGTLALMGLGMAGLGLGARRKKKA